MVYWKYGLSNYLDFIAKIVMSFLCSNWVKHKEEKRKQKLLDTAIKVLEKQKTSKVY